MTKDWTKAEIEKLTSELGGETIDDAGAHDIAAGILSDEDGLKESIIRVYNVKDPLGWLADRV